MTPEISDLRPDDPPAPLERFEWTEARVALLGTAPDEEVAEAVGTSAHMVWIERKRRGIAAFVEKAPAVKWTEEMVKMLGKVPDRVVAEKYGISTSTVHTAREDLGIPPFRPYFGKKYVWRPEALARLGKATDEKVAAELGVSANFVLKKRRRLGIPAWRPHADAVAWTPAMDADFATMTDEEMAGKWRIGVKSVNDRRHVVLKIPTGLFPFRWTAAHVKLLGTDLDWKVAEKLGCSTEAVRWQRKKRKIPLANPPPWIDWTPEIDVRLGKERDEDIAVDLDCSRASVTLRRNALGIAPLDEDWRSREWTAEQDAMLGVLTDSEVARRLKTDRQTVRRRRESLNRPPAPFEQAHVWTPEMDALLGTDSDVKIGRRIGRTGPAVCLRRKKLGIPSMSERLGLREWRERES